MIRCPICNKLINSGVPIRWGMAIYYIVTSSSTVPDQWCPGHRPEVYAQPKRTEIPKAFYDAFKDGSEWINE